jgi:hypothetical protein
LGASTDDREVTAGCDPLAVRIRNEIFAPTADERDTPVVR